VGDELKKRKKKEKKKKKKKKISKRTGPTKSRYQRRKIKEQVASAG
jgi:hypothetical protein